MALNINKIIIVLIIFLGANVLSVLGLNQNTFNAFLLFLSIYPLFYFGSNLMKNQSLIYLLVYVTMYSIYMLIIDKGEGTRYMVLTILSAPMLISALPDRRGMNILRNLKFWRYVLLVVAIGYVFETGLAVFERLIGHNVFGWKGDVLFTIGHNGETDYRSTALYGHPLNNALMVTTAMAFILVSKLKNNIKFSLWFIGFISMLCFNSRSGIVGNALLLIVYLSHTIFVKKGISDSKKCTVFFVSILMASLGYLLVFYYGFGGRLLSMGLFDDDSAQTRVNAWSIFDYYSVNDFLFSHTLAEVNKIRVSLGIFHLENPWLGYIVRNGILFLMLYVCFYFFLFKNLLKEYVLFDKFFVLGAFLITASTSNSLDSNYIFLFYFMLLSILFSPRLFNRIVESKYLM